MRIAWGGGGYFMVLQWYLPLQHHLRHHDAYGQGVVMPLASVWVAVPPQPPKQMPTASRRVRTTRRDAKDGVAVENTTATPESTPLPPAPDKYLCCCGVQTKVERHISNNKGRDAIVSFQAVAPYADKVRIGTTAQHLNLCCSYSSRWCCCSCITLK